MPKEKKKTISGSRANQAKKYEEVEEKPILAESSHSSLSEKEDLTILAENETRKQ